MECYVDNIVTYFYLLNQGRRKRHLNKELRPFFFWAWDQNIEVRPLWVPSDQNPADRTRRGFDAKEACLSRIVFLTVVHRFRIKPVLDVFGSHGNSQCPLYVSQFRRGRFGLRRAQNQSFGDAPSLCMCPMESHRAFSQPSFPILQSPVSVSVSHVDGVPLVAPTTTSLRSIVPSSGRKAPSGPVSTLLEKAASGSKGIPCLRDVISSVFSKKNYPKASIQAILEKLAPSLKRYDSAFRLFCSLSMEMGYSFPDVTLLEVVNVLSTMHQVSPSQESSAYSALFKFFHLTSLSFDPAVRALRRRWTTSVPKYVVFWKGVQLVAFLAAQKLDHSSKIHVRARLFIAFRLFQLYRSFDLSNMLRVLATYDGKWFELTRRKGWANLRWDRVMSIPSLPDFCPLTLLRLYLRLTPEGALPDGVEPKRVFLAVVRPFGALSSDRIAIVTKELLVSAGIDMELFGAHTTRAVGLALLRALGLLAEQAAEIGNWANLQAFFHAYSRVGAADVLSDALQRVSYVHTRPSICSLFPVPLVPSTYSL